MEAGRDIVTDIKDNGDGTVTWNILEGSAGKESEVVPAAERRDSNATH